MKTITFIFINILFATIQGEEKCEEKKKNRLRDQEFGIPLTSDDLLTSMMTPWMLRDYFRPWRYFDEITRDFGSTIVSKKDKFQFNLDVQHYAPDEIKVKTGDGYVIVEAKHEEKRDEHGSISRQFVRKYSLPDDVKSEDVVSQLSSDGILSIKAPRKEVDSKGERVVPSHKQGLSGRRVKTQKRLPKVAANLEMGNADL